MKGGVGEASSSHSFLPVGHIQGSGSVGPDSEASLDLLSTRLPITSPLCTWGKHVRRKKPWTVRCDLSERAGAGNTWKRVRISLPLANHLCLVKGLPLLRLSTLPLPFRESRKIQVWILMEPWDSSLERRSHLRLSRLTSVQSRVPSR